MKKTLYDILGVANTATTAEINSAYQERLQAMDSDANADPNVRTFLREAFHILSQEQRRSAYDASLATPNLDDLLAAESRTKSTSVDPMRRTVIWSVILLTAFVLMFIVMRSKAQKLAAAKQQHANLVQVAPPAPAPAAKAPTPVATADSSAGKSAEEIYALRSPSIALIAVFNANGALIGSGSGVVIDRGIVITNCHVALMGAQLKVKVGSETNNAAVSLADEEYDLCKLEVSGLGAPAVELGSVDTLRAGQKVFTIGAPQGLDLTISDGIISSLRETSMGMIIQTTAPISPGSSGGGMFDTAGRLVGITTFQSRAGQNLNFAVPVDWIRDMHARRATQSVGARTMGGEQ